MLTNLKKEVESDEMWDRPCLDSLLMDPHFNEFVLLLAKYLFEFGELLM